MTWTGNFTGHIEDRSQEKAVADVFRSIVPQLKELGMTAARFYGNEHQEDFLAEPEAQAPEEGEA